MFRNNQIIEKIEWLLLLIFLIFGLLRFQTSIGEMSSIVTISYNVKAEEVTSLEASKNDKTIIFTVYNVKEFNKIKYELTYDSNQGKQGILGESDLSGDFTRETILGTCSEGGCIYHTNIVNLKIVTILKNNNLEKILTKIL